MTPMEKLKPQFNEFKKLLENIFKEINLNKSEYKEESIYGYGEYKKYINKGVKSDFIRLYKAKLNKEDTYTLGFSFNYIDLESNKQSVTFTSTIGSEEKFFSDKKEMSVEETRESLKKIITQLKDEDIPNVKEMFQIVQEEFLGKKNQIQAMNRKNKIK